MNNNNSYMDWLNSRGIDISYVMMEDSDTVVDGSGIEIDSSDSSISFYNTIMDSIDSTIENAVSREMSFLDKPKYKKVLTQEGEDKLKRVKFKDSEKRNASCPILFIPFEEEDEIIELECKHCFNEESIKKWLKEEKAECPVCRFILKDVCEEKIEKPEVSPDELRDNMRLNYINYLNRTINEVYENETEIALQRLLMEQYTHYE